MERFKKLFGNGITRKYIYWTVIIILLLDVLSGLITLINTEKMLHEDFQKKGGMLSEHIAFESFVFKNETENLRQILNEDKISDRSIEYILITYSNDNFLVVPSDKGREATGIEHSGSVMDFIAPIPESQNGLVKVGIDRSLIDEKINNSIRIIILNLLIDVFLGFLMTYMVGNYLSGPLKTLVKGAQEIGRGNLGYKIETISTGDEIQTLSTAFRQMQTDLDKSMSDLRTSEEKYRNIIELTTDIIYTSDRHGNQTFMNDAACRLLETTQEEIIGKPWIKWIHPDDRDATLMKFNEMIEKKIDVFNFENRYISKSGRVINALHNVRIIRDENGNVTGTQGIARDITQRRKGIEKLTQLFSAVEEAPDGIQIVDMEGHITYSNKAVEKIYGFTAEEFKGKHVNSMNADPEFAGKVIIPEIQKKGRWKGELMVKHKDGREFPILLSTSMVKDNKGTPIAMIGVIRDLTGQKEKEMQLMQTYKLATIGQLAAGTAHEINNPLGNISLYAQMLLNKIEDEDSKEKLTIINDEANRAAQIVKGLLHFARQTEPMMSNLDLNNEIEKVFTILSPQLKGIKVITEFQPMISIKADSNQIQQVLINMLTNSIQSITENGEIIVRTSDEKDHVEISITDNGCGIPEENLSKIFDPFFTTKKPGEGTGLGLSISYGIIKRHGGSIDVKSQVGKGTTFIIKLPK